MVTGLSIDPGGRSNACLRFLLLLQYLSTEGHEEGYIAIERERGGYGLVDWLEGCDFDRALPAGCLGSQKMHVFVSYAAASMTLKGHFDGGLSATIMVGCLSTLSPQSGFTIDASWCC